MADFDSGQGRSDAETEGAATPRRRQHWSATGLSAAQKTGHGTKEKAS